MQISITASGSPAEVINSVGQQIRQARAANPDAGALLYTLRDHALKDVAAAGEHAAVHVSIEATVSRAIVERLDGQPMTRDAEGRIIGEPLRLTDEQRANLPLLEQENITP